jgi:hypothetical protein
MSFILDQVMPKHELAAPPKHARLDASPAEH